MRAAAAILILLAISAALAADNCTWSAGQPEPASGVPCTSSGGLPGYCTFRAYSGTCGARVCFAGVCEPNDIACSRSNVNGTCVQKGRTGKCDASATCRLDDKPCLPDAVEGVECVLASVVGTCATDNEQIEHLCARHLNDPEAYDLCVSTLPASLICDINVPCPNPTGCWTAGRRGDCRRTCVDYSDPNAKVQRPCPTPRGGGDFFTHAEAQSICTWSYDSAGCVLQLQYCQVQRFDQFRVACVLEDAAQLYPFDECFRHDTGCAAEFDFCIEKNLGGVCMKNVTDANLALYCHDRSDACPKNAACNAETGEATNATVAISGTCNEDHDCVARYTSCESHGQVCWEGGLKGVCDETYTCILDDTPPCKLDRLDQVCTRFGHSSTCGYPSDVLTHHCPDLRNGCIWIPDYGLFCPDEFTARPNPMDGDKPFPQPPPPPPKFKRQATKPWSTPSGPQTHEQCLETVRVADEPVRCLVSTYCSEASHANETCYSEGFPGRCETICYVPTSSSSQQPYVDCTGDGSKTMKDGQVDSLVGKVCAAQPGASPTCVSDSSTKIKQNCGVFGEVGVYDRLCTLRFLGVGYSSSCRRDDTVCAKEGGFCVQNNLAGKCQKSAKSGVLECHELSDDCPTGSPCQVPYSIGYPGFPGGPGNGFPGMPMSSQTEMREGVCDSQFQCRVRQEPCSSKSNNKCYVDGKAGSCVSRSVAQQQQLAKCVAEAPDVDSCWLRYSICFGGCRYGSQICGPMAACAYDSTRNDELVCAPLLVEPARVAEIYGSVVLIQVSFTQSNYYPVQQAVSQALTDHGLRFPFYQTDKEQGFVVLPTGETLSKKQFDLLEVAAASMRLANGITNANVVLGAASNSTKPDPDALCGKIKCSVAAVCRGDKCLRAVDHGLCEELATGLQCTCNRGWRGDECAESDSTSSGGEVKLSQWVFDKRTSPIDVKSARSLVAGAFDATVEQFQYELTVTETDSYITVRVYSKVATALLSHAQVTELRSAHVLLQRSAGLATHTIYFPVPLPPAKSAAATAAMSLAAVVLLGLAAAGGV